MEQKLAAVLYADVAGYSRLTGEDEIGTHRTLSAYLDVIARFVAEHQGRVVHYAGDAVLADFGTVSNALSCAVSVQHELESRSLALPEERRVRFRVGVNLGEVIVDRDDIYGDGVNIAARLESLADPGGICISGAVHDAVGAKLPLDYEFMGEQHVKNIAKPVRAYRVRLRPGAKLGAPPQRNAPSAAPRARRRALAIGATVVLAIAAAGVLSWLQPWVEREDPASIERMVYPLPDKPSLAVLPFANMSGDAAQDYVADGLTENLITTLSQLPEIFVIARNSTFTYKGRSVKVQQVAEELGVRYVLEGSFQRSGDRIRVHAQFIDALSGRHLWAERFDGAWGEVFSVQDDLTEKITSALSLQLSAEQRARLARRFTESVEAYDEFLRGQALYFRYSANDNALAREHYLRATEIDPRFARAYGGLALTWLNDFRFDWNDASDRVLERATALARKAVELDPDLPQAHMVLGTLEVFQRQHDAAIAAAEKAIALDPNYADAYVLMAISLSYAGRAAESVAITQQGIRLNPLPPAIYFLALGRAQYFAGRPQQAVASLTRAVELNPTFLISQVFLTAAHARLGDADEIEWQKAQLLALDPDFSVEGWTDREAIAEPSYLARLKADLRSAGMLETPRRAEAEKTSLVVLPFTNMSDDPEQEYFADGISEDLTTDLSRVSALFVIARNSAFAYKGRQRDVRQIAAELGVRYVLEGSVRRAGHRVRINAQLIDADSGGHLWAERYDGVLDDVFALQDQVTAQIVDALEVKLTATEKAQLAHRETVSAAAYDYFLRGQALWSRFNGLDNERAREMYRKALELDPLFARAHGALALTYAYAARFGWSVEPTQALATARELAAKAVRLDASGPQVQFALGTTMIYSKRPLEGIEAARRAIELEPNYADAYALLAFGYTEAGRAGDALEAIEQALARSPHPHSFYLLQRGRALYLLGRHEEAIESLGRATQQNPGVIVTRVYYAAALAQTGRLDDAEWEVAEILSLAPDFSVQAWAEAELFTDDSYLAALVNGLRKAGLPE